MKKLQQLQKLTRDALDNIINIKSKDPNTEAYLHGKTTAYAKILVFIDTILTGDIK